MRKSSEEGEKEEKEFRGEESGRESRKKVEGKKGRDSK